ncbi:UDP-N-acetylenolpyruvoylglucosamine reductase [Fusobacterium necrophorum subsp. funduliforme]|uniref:UDP-N-acetylenolpyruvoylglucosamine reductase n=1 Tax=Fusobacterium necrophorum subsp. funduliforme TaxID=143387 RepID=A0A170MX02_9FUSO|nr:UDP-N-acetylmuramate dehydrogenase [Fusobacterium necrophorum]AYV92229.1 UDP-N-acetylmuramate dehydrogenase [Fusobacterium necrophorum subsp. funduliforme]KYL04997.1 UDP-N-acetylenolpyruvoylglucosamine reductase [Fusobacterium necrophorum subsp. funduliforme]KYM46003.1 UDP-N-acetylenolpyruvoylglucosamine reductase [Fusobacterium necrophorum subsp. funduliforme]KYM62844.1 UDP-N-acetylenolpyruvoylglucosamine reductase [Fusobacterium necrophorum subsp. funduliforme]KYM67063.1 UDP-N-acetylenolp
MKIVEQQVMKEYSNMKIGGKAKRLIIVDSREEMKEVYQEYDSLILLGNGTNVLFGDGYLDYNFVSTENLNKIEALGNGRVLVEAGVDLDALLCFMEKENLSGIEKMAGIPGSIGGLTYMNGGAFGTEIFDFIDEIEVLTEGNILRRIPKKDLNIRYRNTEIQEKKWIVLSVIFQFYSGFDKKTVEEIKNSREEKHPLDKPSLGSTFKNPKGDFAARLISEAGLKGRKIGGAQIAEKHPNFVLNLGEASFQDILDILNLVKTTVKEAFGVQLEEEIIIIR